MSQNRTLVCKLCDFQRYNNIAAMARLAVPRMQQVAER